MEKRAQDRWEGDGGILEDGFLLQVHNQTQFKSKSDPMCERLEGDYKSIR